MINSAKATLQHNKNDDCRRVTAKHFFRLINGGGLFIRPCQCCGNSSHGVLEPIRNQLGEESIELVCPIVRSTNLEKTLSSTLSSMHFSPDPRQFASTYINNYVEAFRDFQTRGYGRKMHYMELVDFDNDVLREIENLTRTTRKEPGAISSQDNSNGKNEPN